MKKKDRRAKATEMTARLARESAPMVQGVHFMPLGWTDVIPKVVQELKVESLPQVAA